MVNVYCVMLFCVYTAQESKRWVSSVFSRSHSHIAGSRNGRPVLADKVLVERHAANQTKHDIQGGPKTELDPAL